MGRLAPGLGILIALVAVAVVVGSLTSGSSNKDSQSIIDDYRVNEAVRSVTVTDQNNQPIVLDKAMPNNTLITFWDATCGECETGLRTLQAFVAAHPNFLPIYINVKNPREQADQAMEMYGLRETYYDQAGDAFAAWSGTMPATYLVRNGAFQIFFPGRPSAEHLNALLTLE